MNTVTINRLIGLGVSALIGGSMWGLKGALFCAFTYIVGLAYADANQGEKNE